MSLTTQQISGLNAKGKNILSVIAKRTYTINSDGSCSLSEEQEPIQEEHLVSSEIEGMFEKDTDLYPNKPFTDIVLKGIARSIKKTKQFTASIEIGNLAMYYEIFADRKVIGSKQEGFKFISDKLIQEVPLNYTNAYGGKDLNAERPLRELIEKEESLKYSGEIFDILEGSPYRYPRNPIGKGYVIDPSPQTIEELELPNIEYRNQLLSPQNLVCENVMNWYNMPLPITSDWVHPGWFPRVAYFGKYTLPEGLDEKITEIKHKLSFASILKSDPHPSNTYFDFRACNGASLGLQSNHLTGGQQCRLTNIYPQKNEFIFTIPNDIPKIKIDGRQGKLITTNPVLQTILIEPEENKLTLVWRGSGKALRPYFAEELRTMPYEVHWV